MNKYRITGWYLAFLNEEFLANTPEEAEEKVHDIHGCIDDIVIEEI